MRLHHLLLFILLSLPALSQDVSVQVKQYIEDVRSGKANIPIPKIETKNNVQDVIRTLTTYLADSVTEVRYAGYSLLSIAGLKSTDKTIRTDVVMNLIGGSRDSDSGINGLSLSLLQQFSKSDFSSAAKDSIRIFIKQKPSHYDKLVKLCGYLDMYDQLDVIRNQINNRIITTHSTRWAAYLALCRLGDDQALSYVMERVKKLGLNDDVVYAVFPDLIYTRHPTAIAYLIETLYSDEEKCESANPEYTQQILCGYRILEYLSSVIKNYPIKTGTSGDLLTNNYRQALLQAREWFKSNTSYEILRDKF